MKFTILGCGGSTGVPVVGNDWGNCDPTEPRNVRTRASLLIQSEKTDIIIDTTVELRQQINSANVKKLEGVLFTHAHADHINGFDDLKQLAYNSGSLLNVYGVDEVIDEISIRHSYAYTAMHDTGLYQPFVKNNEINYYDDFTIGDINIKTFKQDHHLCNTVGYRFGDVAYSVDMKYLDQKAIDALKGVKVWIVDSYGYHNEGITHANFEQIFEWIEIIKPEKTYLTVLNKKMDYRTLCNELPSHIIPCYDGMVIEA